MKTFTIAAVALGILAAAFGIFASALAQAQSTEPAPAQAQSEPASEGMLAEEIKTNLTASTLKRCLLEREGGDWRKTYKLDEITNYCSCFAVTAIDRTTQAGYDSYKATGKWSDIGVLQEASKYCANKYLNLPDVSAIRKKKW